MRPSVVSDRSVVSSRGTSIAAVIAWIAALVGLATWLLTTPDENLRAQLTAAQFWSLELCVFLGLVFVAAIARDLVQGLGRRDLARAAAVMGLAAAVTLFVAPRTNRIYYDEQIYQSVGQNLADLKLAQVCNDGTVEYGRLHCWDGEYNKQPYGYPHLLSLAYRVAGVRPLTAFTLNAVVMALTAGAVYLLVWLLFMERNAAFFASLLVALTPQQIIWSATAAVEPSASLVAVAALVLAAHAARSDRAMALAGAAVAVAYAVQFRPESLLIVPVAGLLMWPRIREEFRSGRLRVWWIGLLFLTLVAIHVGHLFAVRNVEWGTTDARLSLRYVADNLRVNGWFFLADERFPVAFTLLALAGLWSRGFWIERLALLSYFVVFFGICLLFYAGSYNYGADVRYSLLIVPPVAALGGLGAARLAAGLSRSTVRLPGHVVVTAALLFQFLWYAPLVRATTEEAWAARADVRFARSFASGLGPNSYVLTHNPGMFQVWGISAGQMSRPVRNPEYLELLATRYAGGVYVHWNFWCNVQDPVHPEVCRKALQLRPFDMVSEYLERDQRFAFYRLR